MNQRNGVGLCIVVGLLALAGPANAEKWTLESVTPPSPNQGDEPRIERYSLEHAVDFLDQASLDWTKERKCFTCHTNFLYLMVRPQIGADAVAHQQVRRALEAMVEQRWPESGPRWDAEVIMTAAVLAMNDASTTGQLHPTTRQALERMWTLQRADGGFDWLKCGWPPMESDDDYAVPIALIACGVAPGAYAQSEAAQRGVAQLKRYLAEHPAPTLHHRAMLVWAESYSAPGSIISPEQRQATVDSLLALQKADGGWGAATLGDWRREDGKPQDLELSDGYGTGFTLYVLRRAGLPADDARLQRAVQWLQANQRTSGRWFTRSLNQDNKHFLSHAGTAFAVLALHECAVTASDSAVSP